MNTKNIIESHNHEIDSVLMLRGLVRNSDHWYDFKELATNRLNTLGLKTYFLDLPTLSDGKGFSFKDLTSGDVVSDLLDAQLPKGRYLILGISLGGLVGSQMIANRPDKYKSLIMVNSSHPKLSSSHQRIKPIAALVILLAKLISSALAERVILFYTINSKQRKTALWHESIRILKNRPWSLIQALNQLLLAKNCKKEMKQNTPNKKLLVLASKKDKLVPYQNSIRIADHYNAKLVIHDSAGHDISSDDASWLINEVEKFISKR